VVQDPNASPLLSADEDSAASYYALLDQTVLLNHVQDAIWMMDLEGEILFWNESAESHYGWNQDDVYDAHAGALLFREDDPLYDKALTAVRTGGLWKGEMRQLCKDGRLLIVESRWKLIPATPAIPPTIMVVNTDVTEKREMEAHVLRSQRMESLGTLAGGIAHDMNNILGPSSTPATRPSTTRSRKSCTRTPSSRGFPSSPSRR
jgi:PAS domain S-box-containing protein